MEDAALQWGSVADWVMAVAAVLSLLVALAAVIIAGLSLSRVGKANKTAEKANVLAGKSNTIASHAQAAASVSARAAERSADAAHESNGLAERSLALAGEAHRLDRLRIEELHDVYWRVDWAPTPAPEVLAEGDWIRALGISNTGPDSAFDIEVGMRVDESWLGLVKLGNLGPGDGLAITMGRGGPYKIVSSVPPEEIQDLESVALPMPVSWWNLEEDPHFLSSLMQKNRQYVMIRWRSAMRTPYQRNFVFEAHEKIATDDTLRWPISVSRGSTP